MTLNLDEGEQGYRDELLLEVQKGVKGLADGVCPECQCYTTDHREPEQVTTALLLHIAVKHKVLWRQSTGSSARKRKSREKQVTTGWTKANMQVDEAYHARLTLMIAEAAPCPYCGLHHFTHDHVVNHHRKWYDACMLPKDGRDR